MDQRTDEWFTARLGKVTASRVSDVLAKIKTGEAAVRADYRAQLVAERLTGMSEPSYTNGAMQWGTEKEPEARAAYEIHVDNFVHEVGFIDHPLINMSGASPDGLIGETGLIEIKCPNSRTHIETLKKKAAPAKYLPQMYWQMACTGRIWCDFVSFDPRMPRHLQLFVVRVNRDDDEIARIEKEVQAFLDEVEEEVECLIKSI